ncbi:hypothetical protein O181_103271 [Austropuccinia psidii MF-1]|uniref:Uncharacterized protein n=1 Tax=Austropuccinia psidii MF-1 TaxID=1389203 RepID=A0A9Q3PKC9_9BASI|nr:hypothetical protein [Austropuccinia psidii MF-1]
MPDFFWCFAYASACFLHNQLPNSHCKDSSPHQQLFGQAPSIATLYPFGADAIIHIPTVQQNNKLSPRGVACRLLKPLMSGVTGAGCEKGSLSHVANTEILRQVPTEQYSKDENMAIDTLPVTKDITIPKHLGQALSGPLSQEWRKALWYSIPVLPRFKSTISKLKL